MIQTMRDEEISLLKAKAEKLKEQKKGLMQVLLTGKNVWIWIYRIKEFTGLKNLQNLKTKLKKNNHSENSKILKILIQTN